jgi:uncharacterized integral membrane protein
MTRLGRFLLFLFLFLVLVAGFVFMLNNTTRVSLWLGTELPNMPVGLWVLLAFGVGGMLGLLLGMGLWQRLRAGLRIRDLQARLLKSEAQLAHLQKTAVRASGTEAGD